MFHTFKFNSINITSWFRTQIFAMIFILTYIFWFIFLFWLWFWFLILFRFYVRGHFLLFVIVIIMHVIINMIVFIAFVYNFLSLIWLIIIYCHILFHYFLPFSITDRIFITVSFELFRCACTFLPFSFLFLLTKSIIWCCHLFW